MTQNIQSAAARRRAPMRGHIPGLFVASVVAGVAVLLAGCGQEDRDTGSRVSTSSTSTAPDDTTGAGAGGATGSDPDVLDDGTHHVEVDSVDVGAGTVAVDGMQVLEGTEAVLAYLADTDGQQLEGPQVYLRNHLEELQDLPVDPDGEFAVIFGPECCEPRDLGWEGFAELSDSGFPDVWGVNPPFEATIADGVITSLVQVYVP